MFEMYLAVRGVSETCEKLGFHSTGNVREDIRSLADAVISDEKIREKKLSEVYKKLDFWVGICGTMPRVHGHRMSELANLLKGVESSSSIKERLQALKESRSTLDETVISPKRSGPKT